MQKQPIKSLLIDFYPVPDAQNGGEIQILTQRLSEATVLYILNMCTIIQHTFV